jgi:hypothetical protein
MSYLTTGRKSAMYGTQRTGVRLVLTNTTDPTRVDEYSTWYDEYGDALLRIGRLVNDFRFENTSASGDEADPRFAAVYDIATPDPATAWPDTEASPDYPRDLFDDPRSALVSPVLRGSYALVGTQTRPGEHGPITGIHLVLSDGADDTSRQHREHGLLDAGPLYAAARFRLIDGAPDPAQWLEIFETDDPQPENAFARALTAVGDRDPAPAVRRQGSFRLVPRHAGAPFASGTAGPTRPIHTEELS